MNAKNNDENYMQRCFALAKKSRTDGDWPFGALLVQNDNVIAESGNAGKSDVTGHAEIEVLKKAMRDTPDIDFSKCTLYTNFEPCAMCSFVIRDNGIGRVVFSVSSPYWGGYSRWSILADNNLRPEFTSRHDATPPQIIANVLEKEGSLLFDELGWEMHKQI